MRTLFIGRLPESSFSLEDGRDVCRQGMAPNFAEKNNEVRHNVLALAIVFIHLWTPFYSQGGGLYARQNYLCRNLS